MWIVRLALRRPYTFAVLALLIGILGAITIARTPTDIFPNINIPVVSVIWLYNGLSAQEMEGRIVTVSERAMTTTVNSIEHIESQSLNGSGIGAGVIRVFFQPDASIDAAVAEVTAINQTLLRILPPGIDAAVRSCATPPPTSPSCSSRSQSPTLSEQQLYDYGLNFIRTQLATVQGAQVPLPWGGKTRQIMVDLDPDALYAKGLSPTDVSNAAQHAERHPARRDREDGADRVRRPHQLVARRVRDAERHPGAAGSAAATVYLRDVAQVHDGFAAPDHDGPRRRPALGAAHGPEDARRVDARHRAARARRAAAHPGDAAAGAQGHAAVRSVGVRARGARTACSARRRSPRR